MASIWSINSGHAKCKNNTENISNDKDSSLQRILKKVTLFCDLINAETLSVLRIIFRIDETILSDRNVSKIKSRIVMKTILLEMISTVPICINVTY